MLELLWLLPSARHTPVCVCVVLCVRVCQSQKEGEGKGEEKRKRETVGSQHEKLKVNE